MDNLDRMFRHLARTLRSKHPQYLTQPLDVAELYQNVLPYRHHRRELGLETNEDYEITLTELLSGARDYLIVDDRMRDVLRTELASTNPDPSAFKQFASASVSISPAALRGLEIGPEEGPRTSMPAMNVTAERPRPSVVAAPAAPPPPPPPPIARPVTTPAQMAASVVPSATPSSQPTITPRSIVPQVGEKCRSCDEQLPAGRPLTFCPHCGQNVTTMNCPACGSELEVGWKFCPTCGRPVGGG